MSPQGTAPEACAELARLLVDEINTGTPRRGLRTRDATTWHNTDGKDEPLRQSGARRRPVHEVVPDFHFDVSAIHSWENGFAVQYVARGTLPDGSAVEAPACLIGTVRDGKVHRFEEYLDSSHVEGLIAAIRIDASD